MSRNRRGIALVWRWVLISMLALFPIASHALALGKLKVLSALNEPLNAEIDFTSVTDNERKGLAVTLASRADFDAAGVDRPAFLSQIKFMVSRRLDGRYFLQLRTDEPVNEPFLHLLLQVDWPGGRLVREYTALIDPPYQIASKPAPVETPVVTPPAPEATVEPAPTPSAEAPAAETAPAVTAPAQAAKAQEQPAAAEQTPAAEAAAKQEAAPPAETAQGQVPPLGPPDVSAAAQGATPEEAATPKVEPLEAKPKAETPPAAEPAAATPAWAAMPEYDVKKGDTLWRIADKARGSNQDMTLEQVMLAIYRTNKDAFFGNNVNNLKAGRILKMPEREEVESVTAPQARHEFRAQYDAWQEYKLKLAAAAGAVKVAEAPQAAPSGAEAKPAEKPAAPQAAQKAPAKPSKPAAPGAADKGRQDELLKIVRSTLEKQKTTPEKGVTDKETAQETAAQERQALADRAASLDESLESSRMENKDLSEKVGIVRSQLQKESRLIALENQSLAEQAKKAPETKPAETPARPAEKPAATPPPQTAQLEIKPAPAPEKPKPTPIAPRKRVAPPPAPPKEEKGFLATVLEAVQGDLLMPVLIGVVVLLSGGLALVYFRRRQKSIAEFEESILSADAISTEQPATTGTVAAQQPAVTTGGDTSFLSDFSQGGMGNIHTDEVDPVAEAEVYLAYGRDETAEEILKDAVVKNPDRHELKLKLLEIYHQRNDVAAFETLAEELYAALGGRGGKIWEKVEEMGRKLNPENPMFRGGTPAKAPAAKTAAAPAAAMAGKAAAAESGKTEVVSGLDFDMEAPAADKTAAEPAFDLDFGAPKTATADTEEFTATAPASAKGGSDLESLDLGTPADNALDFNVEDKSAAGGDLDFEAPAAAGADNEIKWEPAPAAEVDLAAAAPAGEASGSGQWDETATKLDLAKAYIDMGDAEGARSILQEVMAEGSEAQKKQAQELSTQIA
jgi:pilus assembly protein FimV